MEVILVEVLCLVSDISVKILFFLVLFVCIMKVMYLIDMVKINSQKISDKKLKMVLCFMLKLN